YPWGGEQPPEIDGHGTTYSIVIKDKESGGGPHFGSYCNADSLCPPRQNGPFFITELDPNLIVQWKFQNTNNQACSRNPDGTISCVPNTSGNQWANVGFEWCINAPVVDANGVVYANSEDGNLYAIKADGTLKSNIFLDLALGAAYTPLAIGPDGRIYTENKGTLFVIGQEAGTTVRTGEGSRLRFSRVLSKILAHERAAHHDRQPFGASRLQRCSGEQTGDAPATKRLGHFGVKNDERRRPALVLEERG